GRARRARAPHDREHELARRLALAGPPLQVRLEARRRSPSRPAVLQPRDRRVPRPRRSAGARAMRLRPVPPADPPRVVCIGRNKTATSSFHQAMTRLGYTSLHHGGPQIERAVSDALAAEEPLLSRIDARYDAFSDIGQLSRRFMLLDRQYPGSKFVLTVRPV